MQSIFPVSQLVRYLFVTTFVKRTGTLTVLDNCYADLSHERTKEAIERHFAHPQTDDFTQILTRSFDCRISGFHMSFSRNNFTSVMETASLRLGLKCS